MNNSIKNNSKTNDREIQSTDFVLSSEFIAICDLLKIVGLADSGGRGKSMVAEGIVKVDGITEHRKTAKIRAGQCVTVENIQINVISQK
jgi:ribosome-associated protein